VNPSVFGQSITFTAMVSGTPTGTVTFSDGSTTIGTKTLSGGTATLSYTPPTTGSHTITASYSGDSTFAGSSGSLTQTVNQANTSTAVNSSVNPSASGQLVTFTATLSIQGPGAGTPTGMVTFTDATTTTTLSQVPLSGNTASVSTTSLGVGNHTITASYNGDTNFAGSSGSLTQTVNQASTATSVEDFEHGLGIYHSSSYNPVGFYPYARTGTNAAHDKLYGLDMPTGYGWVYRSDQVVQQGQTLSVWVQFPTVASGRAYFGFGASTAGTLSVVLAADTNQLILQDNNVYSFSGLPSLAAAPQSYQPNHWYQLQVTWATGGGITATLYDSNGTTPLNTVQATDNRMTSGGIAFLASSSTYDKYFDTVTAMTTIAPHLVPPGSGGQAANGPHAPVSQGAADNRLAFFSLSGSLTASLVRPVTGSSAALSVSEPTVPFGAGLLLPVSQQSGIGRDGFVVAQRDDDAKSVTPSHQTPAGENVDTKGESTASQEGLVTDAYFARLSVVG